MKRSTSRGLVCGMSLMLAAGSLSAQEIARVGKGYRVSLNSLDRSSQQINFKLGAYRLGTVELDGQAYTRITCDSSVVTERKGYAELPFFHAALQLPSDRQFRVVIEDLVQEDIALDYPMLPSRGVIYRNQDPNKIRFQLAESATREGFYPAELVTASEPFILRDVKGQNLYFNAVQYDAATMTLRVTKSMTVRLEEVDHVNDDCLALMTRGEDRPVVEMDQVYGSLFMNYVPASKRWPNEIGEAGDILVLTTSRDKAAIQPWVNYKKQKGFKIEVKEVQKGTDVTATIKQAYQANKKLLYVQLVGDYEDIKSPNGTSSSRPMDPTMGWITNDNYAELIIGRFSAAKAADVSAQVKKSMGYDSECPGSWIKQSIGIASSEGAGQGDDKQSDIQHMSAIRDKRLKPNGYTIVDAHGKSPAKSIVRNAWNKGVSIINYVGHGSDTSWGTTGFSNSDASALKNGNKCPVIVSVACVNGNFGGQTCFAEAILRNPSGGGVGMMGSTINQPWQPPMRGQDYFNDMLIGGYKYSGSEKGTATDHGKTTFGSLATNACVLMYAESAGSSDLETIQTWTNFGDVTLSVRTPKNPNPGGPSNPGPGEPPPQPEDPPAPEDPETPDTPVPPGGNMAKGKKTDASSGTGAAKAVDGNASTQWTSASGSKQQWLEVDLGLPMTVTHAKLCWPQSGYARSYKIQAFDGSTWVDIHSITNGASGWKDIEIGEVDVQRVRVLCISGSGSTYGIQEFQLFNKR